MSSRLARRTTRWNWVVPTTTHQGRVASIYRAAESKVFSEVCRCKGVRYGDTRPAERWFGRASEIDRAQLKGRRGHLWWTAPTTLRLTGSRSNQIPTSRTWTAWLARGRGKGLVSRPAQRDGYHNIL